MSMQAPYRNRIRDDEAETGRYYAMSQAPYNYRFGFVEDGLCDASAAGASTNCKQYHVLSDVIDASNALLFGEPFQSYEPGHAVSRELINDASVFKARGEGVLAGIDNDSSLRPEPSNVDIIRARKDVEGTDLTGMVFPPLDIQYAPCNNLYAVVADNGSDEPRGGFATRVAVRNAVSYVSR